MTFSENGSIHMQCHELFQGKSSGVGCLALNPLRSDQGHLNSIVIGDQNGLLTNFKIGEYHRVISHFEISFPNQPITRITTHKGTIYFSCGTTIHSLSSSGKLLSSLQTNATEPITSLQICDSLVVFFSGGYVLHLYRNDEDHDIWLAPEKVHAMIAYSCESPEARLCDKESKIKGPASHACILGCHDRTLRVIRKEEVVCSKRCEAPITALTNVTANMKYAHPLVKNNSSYQRLFGYATSAGSFGGFCISDNEMLQRIFSVIPSKRLGFVTNIIFGDITQDGTDDIILGREDGLLEVHAVNHQVSSDMIGFRSVARENIGEMITGLCFGPMSRNDNKSEIIVHTFSGKVVSLLPQADEESFSCIPLATSEPFPDVLPSTVKKTITGDDISEFQKSLHKRKVSGVSCSDQATKQYTQASESATKLHTSFLGSNATVGSQDQENGKSEQLNVSNNKKSNESNSYVLHSSFQENRNIEKGDSMHSLAHNHDAQPLQLSITEIEERILLVEEDIRKKKNEYLDLLYKHISGVDDELALSDFAVRLSMSLEDSNVISLSIDAEIDIELVTLQSDVGLMFLHELSESLISEHSLHLSGKPPHTIIRWGKEKDSYEERIKVSAVIWPYRNGYSHRRICIKFLCQEGQKGAINLFVFRSTEPCHVKRYTVAIQPLLLHARLSDDDEACRIFASIDTNQTQTGFSGSLPNGLSLLKIKGSFTVRDAHGWLLDILPDLPEIFPLAASKCVFYFRHNSIDTLLQVVYQDKEVTFCSDSFVTLNIAKKYILEQGSERGLQLRTSIQGSFSSLRRHLSLLHTLFQSQDEAVEISKLELKNDSLTEGKSGISFLSNLAVQLQSQSISRSALSFQEVHEKYFIKECYLNLLRDAIQIFSLSENQLNLSSSLTKSMSYEQRLEELLRNFHRPSIDAFFTELFGEEID